MLHFIDPEQHRKEKAAGTGGSGVASPGTTEKQANGPGLKRQFSIE